MPSKKPKDITRVLASARFASPVDRTTLSLGQFTANTTVTPAPRFTVDRLLVVRELWIACDAIPSDTDGTMVVNAKVNDITEGADDVIVSAQDLETLIVAANKGYKMTLAAETSENELTLEPGDTLRFELVNNSAAINTNVNVSITVIFQTLKAL